MSDVTASQRKKNARKGGKTRKTKQKKRKNKGRNS